MSEGRLVELSSVKTDERGRNISETYGLDPPFAQLVAEESDCILGGIQGFVLASVSGTLAPNAGYDRSNVPKGFAIQYPKNPFETAQNLRKKLLEIQNQEMPLSTLERLGIILSDSRVTPTRLGTVGVAISWAGIKPTVDMRGTPDLLGNNLVVTLRAAADQLATAAQLVMGESDGGRPVALIRGFYDAFVDPRNELELKATIEPAKCLILSGLANGLARS